MGRVLVTGCSTGVGRASAVELARRGYDVVATARRSESIADLDVGMRLELDVDDDRSVEAAQEAAGEVDVLVNNAAFGVVGPVETVPLGAVRSMFETNVFGVLRMVQAFVPAMRERGDGTVVNVSSVAGRMSVTPLNGLYAATKHALEAISETMWRELRHFGIRVAVVEPGYIATAWARNETWLGVDGPYADLYEQVRAYDQQGQAGAAPAEMVADVIADAIGSGEDRLRWPVGSDAEEAIGLRSGLSDADWERHVLEHTRLDW